MKVFFLQLVGGDDKLIRALAAFMVLNCITTIFMVIVDKKCLKEKLGLRSIFGKIGIIVPICIANIMDTMIVDNDSPIRTMVILFYITREGFNILDNLEQLGVPLPPIIVKAIKQLEQDDVSDESKDT